VGELALLVRLGADSIWGLDQDRILAADHIHTVFHRDPEQYRNDGLNPPFPSIPIADDDIRTCLEVCPELRAIDTTAGPIIYHPELAASLDARLSVFYAALRGALEFAAKHAADHGDPDAHA
jgi:hypothetical protein